jgi:hypothetical protein
MDESYLPFLKIRSIAVFLGLRLYHCWGAVSSVTLVSIHNALSLHKKSNWRNIHPAENCLISSSGSGKSEHNRVLL